MSRDDERQISQPFSAFSVVFRAASPGGLPLSSHSSSYCVDCVHQRGLNTLDQTTETLQNAMRGPQVVEPITGAG